MRWLHGTEVKARAGVDHRQESERCGEQIVKNFKREQEREEEGKQRERLERERSEMCESWK